MPLKQFCKKKKKVCGFVIFFFFLQFYQTLPKQMIHIRIQSIYTHIVYVYVHFLQKSHRNWKSYRLERLYTLTQKYLCKVLPSRGNNSVFYEWSPFSILWFCHFIVNFEFSEWLYKTKFTIWHKVVRQCTYCFYKDPVNPKFIIWQVHHKLTIC